MSPPTAVTPPEQKRWWRAVWRGLVVDAEAKHYRAMGSALWLFIYLVIHANPQSGDISRKYHTIAGEMGISPRTIRSWLTKLVQYDYVTVTRTGRSQVIHINRWKNASAHQTVAQIRLMSGKGVTDRVAKSRNHSGLSTGIFREDKPKSTS